MVAEPKVENKFAVKTCPFCGHAPTMHPNRDWKLRAASVNCDNPACFANPQVTGATAQQAVERWNERYPDG